MLVLPLSLETIVRLLIIIKRRNILKEPQVIHPIGRITKFEWIRASFRLQEWRIDRLREICIHLHTRINRLSEYNLLASLAYPSIHDPANPLAYLPHSPNSIHRADPSTPT
jgi:hypothetical protein